MKIKTSQSKKNIKKKVASLKFMAISQKKFKIISKILNKIKLSLIHSLINYKKLIKLIPIKIN
jgi:hypothetical protein